MPMTEAPQAAVEEGLGPGGEGRPFHADVGAALVDRGPGLRRPPRRRASDSAGADRIGKADVADDAVAEEGVLRMPLVRSMNWSGMTMCPGAISSFRLPTAETEMIRSTPELLHAVDVGADS